MTPSNPLLSVITPVHNGEAFLAEAIASVRRQDCDPPEIIIVDDGSTDGTPGVIASLGDDIHVIRQTNRGPSAARNRALEIARGEVIGFLDADDWWPEDKLQLQLPYLLQDPSLDVAMGRVQYVAMPGIDLPDINFEDDENRLTCINLGAGLFRKAIFDRVGLFDESLRFSEDQDWFLRAREQEARILLVTHTALCYRLHQGNMTRDKDLLQLKLLAALKRSLDRRRQQNGGQARSLAPWSSFSETPPPPAGRE